MWVLLGISITTSFFDSLNPSAIAQQMLLQTMVKNKRHIWFFILGIGMANFVLGLSLIHICPVIAGLRQRSFLPALWNFYRHFTQGLLLVCYNQSLVNKERKNNP